ncbi:MAG: glycosyl hydrolase [Candidatus Methylacidiphilales bacterium]|nr:glycosyl hydrolase [Candidatus Methylacidiphilales bacterium]
MISRRKFISLSTASAAAISFAACQRQLVTPEAILPQGAKKKGLGQTVKFPGWEKKLTDLRCKWFYSWNHRIPETKPDGTEFIPMIYRYGGDPGVISETAVAAKTAGIKELLGFNEPDKEKQGNMTLEQTLAAWPLLMETGLRLGSPGCTHPDTEWMVQFMAAAKQRSLRVDFVCVHSYGGPNPEAFVKRLEKVYQMFGLPLWITEFAVGDWNAKSVEENKHKPETVLRFMEQVLPMLDKLDFVERYAWFPAKTTSIPLYSSALFDADGNLTPLGQCYRDA